MKRIIALLRQTWWLWALLYGSCALLTRYVDRGMLVCFPILFLVFFYFAFVRFDEDGNPRD